jgi:non-canonical purine NTP pyrophosphatase (RdgB/HAM1 family)
MSIPFVLVSGNRGKIAEARRAVGEDLEAVEVDLPEIQSLSFLEVVEEKAAEAWRRLGRPLVVEEAGLELSAMNGFPGPLVKWMLEAVGAEGIARTAASLGDTGATARCLLLYRDAHRRVIGEGATAGTLVLPPRGDGGFGWDPVFLPDGETRTFAELAGPEKDAVSHRGRAWRDLLSKLS